MVTMLKPKTVQEAAEGASLQEQSVEALMMKHQLLTEIHPANSSQLEGNPSYRVYTNPHSAKSLLMEQRR